MRQTTHLHEQRKIESDRGKLKSDSDSAAPKKHKNHLIRSLGIKLFKTCRIELSNKNLKQMDDPNESNE